MMPSIKRIDHIAILVEDIHAALTFWRDTLGLQLDHLEEVPDQQAEVAFMPVNESEIELVRPTTDDSGMARYLKKRGPGIHHICFEVDDLEACLEQLKEKGVRLINPEPVPGAEGKIVAFIHPESTGGVLIELCEWPTTK
jgi:methylmalonyl-CoA/ethylmalonyl-CoA epimerase